MTQSEFSTLRSRATHQVDHLGKLLASSRAALPQVRALADTVELLLAHSDRTQADERVALQLTVVRAEVEAAETMAAASATKVNQGLAQECARAIVLAVRAWLNAGGPTPHPDLVEAGELNKPPRFSKQEERKPALKAYKDKHGLRMKDMEKRTGMDKSYIYRWARGELKNSSILTQRLEELLFPRS